MFYKVRKVEPMAGLNLRVQFENGTVKKYDVNPLLVKWPVFRSLELLPGLFDCVRVDAGGYGVVWNDDIDLSCNELWEHGAEVKPS